MQNLIILYNPYYEKDIIEKHLKVLIDKQTNICLIYETRPDICRVDLMFEKKYYKYYTKDEYFKLNIEACNKMQIMFNIDEKYRIKI